MKKKKYRGVDLFCGIGGFRLAMEENDVQCVFSSDIDKFGVSPKTQLQAYSLKHTIS